MRIVDVWLRYGWRGPWILENVDLTLEAGQVVVVVGRNGVGKSTLLQIAAGVLRPTKGAVIDRPATVGWVPERFPAEQAFTARAYLESMARARGLDPAPAISRWARRLYVERHLDARLANLSKGSAQKVGLMQALLSEPELLILDEPWEGLDGQTRDEVPAIVDEVAARGGMVLISDHLGETARLPGAVLWHVLDGHVEVIHPSRPPVGANSAAGAERPWRVEVAVTAADADAAADLLHADGHEVLAVRPGWEETATGSDGSTRPADLADEIADDNANDNADSIAESEVAT